MTLIHHPTGGSLYSGIPTTGSFHVNPQNGDSLPLAPTRKETMEEGGAYYQTIEVISLPLARNHRETSGFFFLGPAV